MNKPRSIELLDVLANRANFADVKDKLDIISAVGKRLSDYITSQGRMFYQWRDMDANKVWTDVEIVTFDDPTKYSSARMYLIRAKRLSKVIRDQSQIDLFEEETPTHSGEEVAEVLRRYATQFP